MKQYRITVNGITYEVAVEEAGNTPFTAAPAMPMAPAVSAAPAAPMAPAAPAGPAPLPENGKKVAAPMPGSIVEICVSVGQSIKAGDRLIVLESMKMENDIVAENNGTVLGIGVNKGDMVNAGDTLLVVS